MVITKEKERVITKEQVARSPGLRLEAQLPAWPEASHASNVTAINRALMIVRVCVAEIITSFYVRLPTTFELVTMIRIELCTISPHQDLWQNRENIVPAFPASQLSAAQKRPQTSKAESSNVKVPTLTILQHLVSLYIASAIMQFS